MSEMILYEPNRLPLRHSVTAGKLVDADVWEVYANIAATVANTEFVPKDMRGKPPTVLACLLYGHDIGLPPMVALREIAMIDGKPSLSAAVVTARVREAGHSLTWKNILGAGDAVVGVTAYGKRGDTGDEGEYTFTVEMARRAGLAGKQNWTKYPESMCWARAATQLARMLFSDVFLGAIYTPEELGADTPDEVSEGSPVTPLPSTTAAPVQSGDYSGMPSLPSDSTSAGDGTAVRSSSPAESGGAQTPPAPAEAPTARELGEMEDASAARRAQKPASAAQKRKLNVLVGTLRDAGRITTEELWAGCGIDPEPARDGVLHWSPLRERLTLHLASALIEHLTRVEELAVADGVIPRGRAA